MLKNIEKYKIILGSNSPRRKELLKKLDIDFEVRVIEGLSETVNDDISKIEISEYLAIQKSKSYDIKNNELLITADTIVLTGDNIVLGKPQTKADAVLMLEIISGKTHFVCTGINIRWNGNQKSFSVISEVKFSNLSSDDIEYYVDKYKPFDKAGAYGIQEWIGCVGVEFIKGSFYNIMGLPTYELYSELKKID